METLDIHDSGSITPPEPVVVQLAPVPEADSSSAKKMQKGKTRERNDAKWETLKDEIYRIYMLEDTPLTVTMLMMEQLHQFKRS